jgi:RNA-splicing ligase RtcB
VPIKSWVPNLEETALAQAVSLSNFVFAIRHIALRPDAHAGYGNPSAASCSPIERWW